MNGITKRCVSIGRGDQDPLKRVNYEFGLVLGVDEFVAEQTYFLEKAYIENRALHGFGTVSGLHVDVRDHANTLEVLVSRGIGIDQYGRMFIVGREQCADLLAWIDSQELEAGDHTLYVTAHYNECLTDLVPIAGEACANSDTLNAASRIKDITAIELTLEHPHWPPATAYYALVNLAAFISRIRVDDANAVAETAVALVDDLEAMIGAGAIVQDPSDFAQHVTDRISDIVGVADTEYISVREDDAVALRDAIFVYWVTEVRPTVEPEIINPQMRLADGGNNGADPIEPDVLLATLNITIPDEGALALDEIDLNNDRPYLLHTQLIQELFRFPEVAAEGGGETSTRPMHEFASIYADDVQSARMWLHVGDDINLKTLIEGLEIFRVGSTGNLNELNYRITEEEDRANDVGRYYLIQFNARLDDGDYLLFAFDTTVIEMLDSGATLGDYIGTLPHRYLNAVRNDQALMAYHIVHQQEGGEAGLSREEVIQIVNNMQRPTVPFVTITPMTEQEGETFFLVGYELWFHLDGDILINNGSIDKLSNNNITVVSEDAAGSTRVENMFYEQLRPNVWFAQFEDQRRGEGSPLLRFGFDLNKPCPITAYNPVDPQNDSFSSIGEYITKTRQNLEGHRVVSDEIDTELLVIYVREQGEARMLR